MDRPIIIFDTSAVNRLAFDPGVDALIAGINDAYFVRTTETVIGELVAHENPEKRKHLFAIERMMRDPGEIILPFHEITLNSIRLFEHSRPDFDWRKVPTWFKGAERYLSRNHPDDQIAASQREQSKTLSKQWEEPFRRMGEHFDDIFKTKGYARPPLDEMLAGFRRKEGSMWIWGKMFYKKDDGTEADEDTVRQFYELCPSFRALLVAVCASQYERCIRDLRIGESLRAGRADIFMAAYLPYCNQFISNDRRQVNLLKQVVSHAALPDCSVVSYEDFVGRLTLNVQ